MLNTILSFAGFWYPAKKHLYFISVSGAFLGTSLPPTPYWSRFDLFIDVYSILFYCISTYTLYFIYCIFTCCKVMHAVLLLLLRGFVFPFKFFCHYFSVSVVCFFCSCVWAVWAVWIMCFSKLCGWGGELQSCFEVLVLLFSLLFHVHFP